MPKLINTSSLRPLTCVRFVVDSYDNAYEYRPIQTTFDPNQSPNQTKPEKQDNATRSTKDLVHRCSPAAQQAISAILRSHRTRLTADKQAANCRLVSQQYTNQCRDQSPKQVEHNMSDKCQTHHASTHSNHCPYIIYNIYWIRCVQEFERQEWRSFGRVFET